MKKIFISFAILAGVTLSGCNDSFLDKLPVTDPTEETVFKSYDNFLAFMWPCYEMVRKFKTRNAEVVMIESFKIIDAIARFKKENK